MGELMLCFKILPFLELPMQRYTELCSDSSVD